MQEIKDSTNTEVLSSEKEKEKDAVPVVDSSLNGNGNNLPQTVTVEIPKRPICPVTKLECPRLFPCAHREESYVGNTMCAEWVLRQREIGRKELEAGIRTNPKTRT